MSNLEDLSMMSLLKLRNDVNAELAKRDEAALTKLVNGYPVKGYVLKKGRKSRKIADVDAFIAACSRKNIPTNAMFTQKLVGIPTIEKYLRSMSATDVFDAHVEITTGSPTADYTG